MGCGPGNSTEPLWQRWPEAAVIGLDRSPEMIEAARKAVSGANLAARRRAILEGRASHSTWSFRMPRCNGFPIIEKFAGNFRQVAPGWRAGGANAGALRFSIARRNRGGFARPGLE